MVQAKRRVLAQGSTPATLAADAAARGHHLPGQDQETTSGCKDPRRGRRRVAVAAGNHRGRRHLPAPNGAVLVRCSWCCCHCRCSGGPATPAVAAAVVDD